jgi:S-adenosylmethionine hydrolase
MRNAPDVAVCDLMVDAPDRNPKAASYLLAALAREFQPGDVVLAVVDPGVGSTRNALVVEADGVSYVGPDNGLFEVIIRRSENVTLSLIDWQPANLSASFHGRDIFAPIAAKIATGQDFDAHPLSLDQRCDEAKSWPDELAEIIYIDTYGNLMTGLRVQDRGASLIVGDHNILGARTFSDVPAGSAFHYGNSVDLCEIAVNCGRADQMFNAKIGTQVRVRATKMHNP